MKLHLLLSFFLLCCFLSCKNNSKSTIVDIDNSSELNNIKTKAKSISQNKNPFKVSKIGDTLDIYNGVYVIYNKSISNTSGRNLTIDGYNLGLKWQCVEFVKRYYYEHLNHKMPNSYGHAKDFFNKQLDDGALNRDRNLFQYANGSSFKPKVNDLLVFNGNLFNSYGHVAIVSKVESGEIELVQQNVGKNSRDTIDLEFVDGKWYLNDSELLGWLRK